MQSSVVINLLDIMHNASVQYYGCAKEPILEWFYLGHPREIITSSGQGSDLTNPWIYQTCITGLGQGINNQFGLFGPLSDHFNNRIRSFYRSCLDH